MALTYRLEQNTSLTHQQMDDNFRSVYYSSSLHGTDGTQLRLWKDTSPSPSYEEINLNPGTGTIDFAGNIDNRVITATGTGIQGESALTFDGTLLTLTGKLSIEDSETNIIIGAGAGGGVSSGENTVIGKASSANITGVRNTSLGKDSLTNAVGSSDTVAIGHCSLGVATSGNRNLAIGSSAGINLSSGNCNIYIGYSAGPGSATAQNNKLYINNAASDTPLILGDFSTGHVTINSTVSASVFSGSYYGDGSNLTGVTATAEWDGSRDGDSSITGSLTVSGSNVVVDLTNTLSVSGSIFSGSFVGDGSGLTGVTATVFPYTGSAVISGSLFVENYTSLSGSVVVSGSFVVANSGSSPSHALRVENGFTIVDKNITISNNGQQCSIGIGHQVAANSTVKPNNSVLIGHRAGEYAGTHCMVAIGNCASCRGGHQSVRIGYHAGRRNNGYGSIGIGYRALGSINDAGGAYNIAIGSMAMGSNPASGAHNIAIGCSAFATNQTGKQNVAIGTGALRTMHGATSNTADSNVAVGYKAGENICRGKCNVLLGYYAGPSGSGQQVDHKLYINNAVGNPLIGGEFSTSATGPSVTISGSLLVSQSVTAASFSGDGSNLTNLPGTEWDGSRNGDAEITGSFVISGSSVTVDFTNTSAISGSTFSGSFVGDGSGLTGVTSEWDGSRNGNADITGSLIVSGTLDVANSITIGSTGYPGSPGIEMIHFHSSSLAGTHNIQSFAISATGYTGFKADYSLTDNDQDQKKIGTLLGGWDTSGGTTINDSHTEATGDIIGTSFNITSDGSTATLRLDAAGGPYEVNMLITAFKRQV